MSHKLYILLLTSFIALTTIGFMWFCKDMQPYSGIQTRTGGYLERDYGWNTPQQGFRKALFTHALKLEQYDRYFDLVVFGDSFSFSETQSWMTYLAQTRGITSVFLHIDELSITDILTHPVFINQPPKYFVVESAETQALQRLRRIGLDLSAMDTATEPKPEDLPVDTELNSQQNAEPSRLGKGEPIEILREKKTTFNERMRIGANFIIRALERLFWSDLRSGVSEIQIDCEHCFSNQKKGYFLVDNSAMTDDGYKMVFLQDAVDNINKLSQHFESQYQTQLRVVIFPGKANAYSSYTALNNNPTILKPPLTTEMQNFIPLMPAFRKAITAGATDFYLPNDQHTSHLGYELAARIIGEELLGPESYP